MSKYEGHTPGPWEVGATEFKNNAHGLPDHIALSIYTKGEQDTPICLVAPSGNVTDEDEANAKLIADAPMLAGRVEELDKANGELASIIVKQTEQNAKMLAWLNERAWKPSGHVHMITLLSEMVDLIVEIER